MRKIIIASLLCGAMAACTPTPQVVEAPPPPPVKRADLAPPNAYYFNYVLPVRIADGRFDTPNVDLTEQERLFHFRSAMNVAALSCRENPEVDLSNDYNKLIGKYRLTLAKANRTIEERFLREIDGGKRARDAHMTSLYNHFARPATLSKFCPVAERMLKEAVALPDTTAAITDYSQTATVELEKIYQAHFAAIEEYQVSYRKALAANGQPVPPIATAAVAEQVGSPEDTAVSPEVRAATAAAIAEVDASVDEAGDTPE
ncbi:MAG: hypothetical protein WA979_13230 [Pacificimonas sp.]